MVGHPPWLLSTSVQFGQQPIKVYDLVEQTLLVSCCGLVVSSAECLMNSSWIRLILVMGLALSAQAQTGTNPPYPNTISPPPNLNRPPSPPASRTSGNTGLLRKNS
jgi:hypothetical protein